MENPAINYKVGVRDLAGAPVPPADFEPLYNSYVTDPLFARRFTWVWVAGTLAFVILYSPNLLSGFKSGRIWQGWAIYERFNHGYRPLDHETNEEKRPILRAPGRQTLGPSPVPVTRRLTTLIKGAADFVQLRVVKGLNLDFGQIIVLTAYLVTLLVCVIYQAPLHDNSNRAGFLSLAQLPFVFIYAAKSSPLTLLLGRGYEKLNFLHRWAGRALFLTATIHGSLWINFYIRNGQAHVLTEDKERRGQATYAMLCLTVLGSLKPVRRFAYNYFYAFHTLVTTAFFISVCYHTPYAVPWVIPPVAFYTFDFLVRLVRMRFKDGYLETPDNQITLIHIPDVSGGWIAGQHVRIRIFFEGRVFEQHPLSILNAPPTISTLANDPLSEKAGYERYGTGMILAARNCGDWSAALNRLARSEHPEDKGSSIALLPVSGEEQEGNEEVQEFETTEGRRVGVLIDGPFGGPSIDFAQSENVLLISGGSGATFTLGILDDLVGRIVLDRRLGKGTGSIKTRKVLFVWCIKSYGAILWFRRQFQAIAKAASDPSLDLEVHFRFFVTCFCSPEDLPPLRNSEIIQTKPVVTDVLKEFIGDVVASSSSRGGLAVAASGPERLTSETRNAVADIGPFMASRLGGVELHTEAYCL